MTDRYRIVRGRAPHDIGHIWDAKARRWGTILGGDYTTYSTPGRARRAARRLKTLWPDVGFEPDTHPVCRDTLTEE